MAPSAIAEVLINKESRPQIARPAPQPIPPPRTTGDRGPARIKALFDESLLERHRFKSSSKTLDLLVALCLHVVVLGGPILTGLYYTDTLNLKAFATTLLVAPPPPPPPPPAAAIVKAHTPKHVFMTGGKLVAPTVIPRQIAEIKEAALEPDSLGGVAGGDEQDEDVLAHAASVSPRMGDRDRVGFHYRHFMPPASRPRAARRPASRSFRRRAARTIPGHWPSAWRIRSRRWCGR